MRLRKRTDGDFQAEIESHIELETDRLIAEGMAPREARAAARRRFGNATRAAERYYESRRWLWWGHLRQDLRYAGRSMRKAPAFTAAAIATIALGVGANTAMFSMVDAVMLRMLPVRNPSQLVFLEAAGTEGPNGAPPYPCFELLRRRVTSFAGLAAFVSDELRVEVDGRAEQVMGQVASGNFFDLLGVRPELGRLMSERDDQLNPPVAVISYRYWRRRFGGAASAIGRTVTFESRVFTIAGVTPAEFGGLVPGHPVDITFPITTQRDLLGNAHAWWFHAVGRLKPGVSAERAREQSNAIFRAFMTTQGSSAKDIRAFFDHIEFDPAAQGSGQFRGRFTMPLEILMAIAGLVLLMAAANIANLQLARGTARRREYAIRLATGAGRGRLLRQLLTETLLLFGAGAIPGVMIAGWSVASLEALLAGGRQPLAFDARIDGRVLGFTVLVTLAAGLLSGLFPAWRAFRTDLQEAMKGETRGTGRSGRVLVAGQVAISVILLVEASAFVRTLMNLRNVDPGFRPEHTLTMSLQVADGSLSKHRFVSYWTEMLDRVRAVPGVESAAMANYTPLSGRDRGEAIHVPRSDPASGKDASVSVNQVSDGYFETMGIAVVPGRTLTAGDSQTAPRVAVINEAVAQLCFAGRDPIGRTVEFQNGPKPPDGYRVVGVVRDAKHMDLREPAARFVFLPLRQPQEFAERLTLAIHSREPDANMLSRIRSAVAEVDRRVLISEVITMQEQLDSTLLTQRLLSGLSSAFGALALALASIGLYGVLSYRIGQQRQAIGVRMALGATPGKVARGVLRETAWVVCAGVFAGLPFAVLAVRAADALFWGLRSQTGLFAMAIVVLATVGFASAWRPARRAAGIDPAEALRHE